MAAHDYLFQPDPDQLADFLGEGGDDELPSIIRIASDEIIYRPTQASFIGDKYLKGDLLGEGSYSKVKEVLDTKTLCRRAVKIVKWRRIRRIPNGIANVTREINILRRLNHRNVIRLIEVFYNEEKMKKYIVLEYCCCNLQAMLDECQPKMFPEWQAHYYFSQLIEGVDYLHCKGIIHKDIKPANLLLTVDQVLKITDLGVSQALDQFAKDDTITTSQGSPVSQAPEIAAGDESFSGFKIDIWSCGITLYRMCTKDYPFDGDTICILYDTIAKAEYTIPPHVSEHLQVLIRGMLTRLPEDRYSIETIRKSRWLREQKAIIGKGMPMPASEDNPAFSMTALSSLKAMIMAENGHDHNMYDCNSSDEVVMNATACYNTSNSAATHGQDLEGAAIKEETVGENEGYSNHSKTHTATHRKQKKCAIS